MLQTKQAGGLPRDQHPSTADLAATCAVVASTRRRIEDMLQEHSLEEEHAELCLIEARIAREVALDLAAVFPQIPIPDGPRILLPAPGRGWQLWRQTVRRCKVIRWTNARKTFHKHAVLLSEDGLLYAAMFRDGYVVSPPSHRSADGTLLTPEHPLDQNFWAAFHERVRRPQLWETQVLTYDRRGIRPAGVLHQLSRLMRLAELALKARQADITQRRERAQL